MTTIPTPAWRLVLLLFGALAASSLSAELVMAMIPRQPVLRLRVLVALCVANAVAGLLLGEFVL